MASFASRPREFNKYTPTVDTEMYAKTLAKKDLEYQTGVKKVENTVSSIAMLPVANEAGREYIQGITDKITSDINERVGADWSDQHLTNQIATHANMLANDPVVSTITGNAAHVRNQFANMQVDDKMSKGANTINKMAFMDDYNEFANSKDPKQSFSSEYFNFQDVDKHLRDEFDKKHPNTRISVQSAGYSTDPKTGKVTYNPKMAMQQRDTEIHEWKGITPLEVKDEVKGIIESNPQLQKQLDLNSKYTYKNLDPEAIIEQKQNVLSQQKDLMQRNLSEIDSRLGAMKPDDPEFSKLKKDRDYLNDQITNVIDPNLTEEAKYQALGIYHNNPSILDNEKKEIFMNDWYNTQMKKFAYGEDKLDLKGQSPSQKQEWQADHSIKVQELILKQNADKRADQKQKDAHAITMSKLTKQYNDFTTSEGIKTEEKSSWGTFNNIYNNARKEVNDKKNGYLYNTYRSLFPDYFKIGDDKGITIASKDAQDKLDDLFQSRYEAYKNGNNKDNKGNNVDLSKRDYQFFADMESQDRVSLAMQDKIEEGKKIVDKQLASDPQANSFYKSLDQLNKTPLAVKKGPGLDPYAYITGNDVQNYTNANKEVESYIKNKKGMTFWDKTKKQFETPGNFFKYILDDPEEEQDKAAIEKIYNKYNLSTEKANAIDIYGRDYTKGISNIGDKREKLLSDFIESSDYLSNPQSTQWVDYNLKDPKTNDAIEQKAVKLLKNIKSPILSSKEPGKQVTISYVQEPVSGDYTMKVEDTKGNHEEYPVASTDVPSEWKNFKDESTLTQLLRINKDPYSKVSNTYSHDSKEEHTFSDALPLTIKQFEDKPTAIKYHVNQEGNNYYVEFWAKDITNPNDPGHILRDPKTKVKIEASASSLKELEVILDNYSKTGKTEPVGFSTYTSSEQEEETTTNE